ncbi:MAG: Fe-S oxidoreductase [Desulfobulbaceae bacterium A2]|nr:MAG: Fe-S oxidoreductase [Desulfobulbaceae bacterium A2]
MHGLQVTTELDRRPVDDLFDFSCHAELSCFMTCCRQLDLPLYPYDIIRLCRILSLSSSVFLQRHVRLVAGDHPFFPALMLKMADGDQQLCPFLGPDGCQVYHDRPTACRTYPLERTVGRAAPGRQLEQHYFLVRHSYCLGHYQQQRYSLSQWEREQGLIEYNVHNDLWAEMNAFFATNPWLGEGKAGPRQRLAFMVCYCVDEFRAYLLEQKLLDTFRVNRAYRRRIATDDAALLRFGYDWLRFLLAGSGPLAAKGRP